MSTDSAHATTPVSVSLTEAVARELRSMIGAGSIAPGEPLVIDKIAALLGVSAQPVREALKVLEGEGRVSHVAHRGAQVVALSRDELLEVYRLRDVLEDEAIRQSAAVFPAEAVDELQRLSRALADAAATGDPELMQLANRDFHEYLRSFNPHLRLDALVTQLRAVSAPYRRRYLEQLADWPRLVADHQAIVEAVAANDADALISAVRRQRHVTVTALLESGALDGPAHRA